MKTVTQNGCCQTAIVERQHTTGLTLFKIHTWFFSVTRELKGRLCRKQSHICSVFSHSDFSFPFDCPFHLHIRFSSHFLLSHCLPMFSFPSLTHINLIVLKWRLRVDSLLFSRSPYPSLTQFLSLHLLLPCFMLLYIDLRCLSLSGYGK